MWPETSQTQELLRRAGAGDRPALDALLERHRDPVRRMIGMRMDPAIARRVDASDIVQEVLLEASRRLAEYLRRPPMPFHLWLRHIARDHLIDAHRRHRRARRRSVDRERPLGGVPDDRSSLDLMGQLLDRDLTPATAAIRREMRERFRAALVDLDEDDREVIVMRHLEHLSNQEVASALGLSEAAASMRYLRAIRRLRGLLSPASP